MKRIALATTSKAFNLEYRYTKALGVLSHSLTVRQPVRYDKGLR